jgi:hypothetical protein
MLLFIFRVPRFLVFDIPGFMLATLGAAPRQVKSPLLELFLFVDREFEIFLTLDTSKD